MSTKPAKSQQRRQAVQREAAQTPLRKLAEEINAATLVCGSGDRTDAIERVLLRRGFVAFLSQHHKDMA